MKTIKQVLMSRDKMSAKDADDLITQARTDLYSRLADDKQSFDICEEWFNLEPDYIVDLI